MHACRNTSDVLILIFEIVLFPFVCNYNFLLYFILFFSQNIIFSMKQLSEIKRVSTGHLHLLGFKPLSCLRDYYNLKPSTFLYPSDEVSVFVIHELLMKYLVMDNVWFKLQLVCLVLISNPILWTLFNFGEIVYWQCWDPMPI